ncbi:MAG TPA: hypothetical protein VHJ20_00930 [Polyangia bacterium]|nr:hypothetical protein [Polyangia bacterium]
MAVLSSEPLRPSEHEAAFDSEIVRGLDACPLGGIALCFEGEHDIRTGSTLNACEKPPCPARHAPDVWGRVDQVIDRMELLGMRLELGEVVPGRPAQDEP